MILVYDDKGVGRLGLYCLLYKLKLLGKPFQIINADFIKTNDLSKFKALIVGGGADIPYCERLGSDGIKRIQNFVGSGGAYIGICAGAYFACSSIEFTGKDYRVFDSRELALFDGTAIGSISELTQSNIYYDETSASKAIVDLSFMAESFCQSVYYHGGCYFYNALEHQVFAKYQQIDKPAIITDSYGRGKYFLSGLHFEIEHQPYREYIEVNAESRGINIAIEQKIVSQLSKCSNDRIWDYVLQCIVDC